MDRDILLEEQGLSHGLDGKIKAAFESGDVSESKSLHIIKASQYASNEYSYARGAEQHKGEIGDFMKSVVFGGLDGIITLFAIVASISGSDLEPAVVLVLGFSKLVGDGISMGVGDFLSEKAEIDFTRSELNRERWEFDNYREGEIAEMVAIYKEKGIEEEDAKLILRTMARYPKMFVDHMMMQELELNTVQIEDNPLKNGCITFASFLFFGAVPLLSYLVFLDTLSPHWKFIIAIILTICTLFGMGSVKAYFNSLTGWRLLRSALSVTLNGCAAAGSAYFIGWGLAELLGVDGELVRR